MESSVIVSALTSVAGQMTDTIGDLLPVALGVTGTIMAVKFGVRFFKSVAK